MRACMHERIQMCAFVYKYGCVYAAAGTNQWVPVCHPCCVPAMVLAMRLGTTSPALPHHPAEGDPCEREFLCVRFAHACVHA